MEQMDTITACGVGITHACNVTVGFTHDSPTVRLSVLDIMTRWVNALVSKPYDTSIETEYKNQLIDAIGGLKYFVPDQKHISILHCKIPEDDTVIYSYVHGIKNPEYKQVGNGAVIVALDRALVAKLSLNDNDCKKIAMHVYSICPLDEFAEQTSGPTCKQLLDASFFDEGCTLYDKYKLILKRYVFDTQTTHYSDTLIKEKL